MEEIDIVDIDINYIRKGIRGQNLKKGEFFKFIHIWIIKDNMILIQKRGYDRLWAPGMWATHTGIVGAGEKEINCASREINEELGIKIKVSDIEHGFTIKPKNRFNGLGFIFFTKIESDDIKIDNNEVIDFKFVDMEELISMIDNNEFIDYGRNGKDYENYFDMTFRKLNEMMEG